MWAKHIAQKEGVELEAGYFGLYHPTACGQQKAGAFDQYDSVFVMEQDMEKDVRESYTYKGEIVCLNVEDREDWSDRELDEVFQCVFKDEALRKKVLEG